MTNRPHPAGYRKLRPAASAQPNEKRKRFAVMRDAAYCDEPSNLDPTAWGQKLSDRLPRALDARVESLRALREARRQQSCSSTARKAGEVIIEWSLIADLLHDLSDPQARLGLFRQRDDIENYVRSITN
jgi:hypothetical protein